MVMKMNSIEQLVKDIAFRTYGSDGIVRIEVSGDETYLETDPFGVVPIGSEWLFRSATSEEAELLLRSFILGGLHVGYGLSCEFARLLAEKGSLVRDQLTSIIDKVDWGSYGTPQFCLAGLHFISCGKQRTIDLLEIVPENWRDGLFTAIWMADDIEIYNRLLIKFEEWQQSSTWGLSSGEGSWLGKFLAKWLSDGIYDVCRMEKLLCWYFANIVKEP